MSGVRPCYDRPINFLADRRVLYIISSLVGREKDIVTMNRGRLVDAPEAARE